MLRWRSEKRIWLRWLRWIGTAGLLFYVLSRIDIAETLSTLSSAEPLLLSGAVAMLLVSQGLRVVRWHVVTAEVLDGISRREATRSWLIGFAGAAIAGEGLGTVAMGIDVRTKANTPTRVAIALVIEKAYEVAVLALFVSTVVVSDLQSSVPDWFVVVALTTAVAGLAMVGFLPPAITRWFGRRGSDINVDVSVFAHGQLLLSSIAARLFQFLFVWLVALSLAINIGLLDLTAVMTVVGFVVMLPISVSGLGPRELIVVELLDRLQIPETAALALSFAIFVIVTAVRGVAALLWARLRSS